MDQIKKDLKQIRDQWNKLDPNVKLLDIITIASIALFSFAFFFVYFLDIPLIVTNIAFMIFPAIMAGYAFIYRSKLNNPEANHEAARKEFLWAITITTLIILSSFLYAILLE